MWEMQEMQVWSLGQEGSVEEEIPTPVFLPAKSHGQRRVYSIVVQINLWEVLPLEDRILFWRTESSALFQKRFPFSQKYEPVEAPTKWWLPWDCVPRGPKPVDTQLPAIRQLWLKWPPVLPVALWLFPASCTFLYLLVCPVVRVMVRCVTSILHSEKVVGFQFGHLVSSYDVIITRAWSHKEWMWRCVECISWHP